MRLLPSAVLAANLLLSAVFVKAQEPPGGFEIMKWYWNGFPKIHNGWAVNVEQKMYMHGWTEGIKHSIVNVTCDTCKYLCKYSFDVILSYGYNDKTELSVTQNKDTTNKYFKIHYPKFPNELTENCRCPNSR